MAVAGICSISGAFLPQGCKTLPASPQDVIPDLSGSVVRWPGDTEADQARTDIEDVHFPGVNGMGAFVYEQHRKTSGH